MGLSTPAPDFDGFANAQATLRQQFGRDVRFYGRADVIYDPSIPASAFDSEGIPLDPLAGQTPVASANVEIGGLTLLTTLQHCLVVFRTLQTSIMRRDETFETALGIRSAINRDLILDPSTAPAIAAASHFQVGTLARDGAGNVIEPEQWQPEEPELWKIVNGKMDSFGPVLRYIVYGQGTR